MRPGGRFGTTLGGVKISIDRPFLTAKPLSQGAVVRLIEPFSYLLDSV